MPVFCTYIAPRVSCEPVAGSASTTQKCYSGVDFGALRITVCTTSASNQEAIVDSGGEELSFTYECGFGDFACAAAESMSRGIATVATGALSWALGNTGFNTESYLWDTATGEWSWWQGAVLLVILGSGIWAIAAAAISGERSDLVGAIVRTLFALPVSMAALWLTGILLNIIDGLVQPLIDRGGAGEGLYDMVQNMIFGGGGGNYALATITLSLLMIGTIVLMVVFSFRNLALAALIAMGPVAFMLFPMKIGRQWVARYAAAVLSLLLTTPLTIGFLMLILRGIGNVESMWSLQAIPFGVGLILIGFAPLAVFGLFSFVGESVGDGAAGTGAGRVTRAASGAGQTLMRKVGQVGRVGARTALPSPTSAGSIAVGRSGGATGARPAIGRPAGGPGAIPPGPSAPSTPPPRATSSSGAARPPSIGRSSN